MTPTEEGLSASLDFERFQHAHTNVERFRQMNNYAGSGLELAIIRERACEIQSQSLESVGKGCLESLGPFSDREKQLIRAAAKYVGFGRI